MVCNTIYENRSMSMNKEKGGIIMDITMMALISWQLTKALVVCHIMALCHKKKH